MVAVCIHVLETMNYMHLAMLTGKFVIKDKTKWDTEDKKNFL